MERFIKKIKQQDVQDKQEISAVRYQLLIIPKQAQKSDFRKEKVAAFKQSKAVLFIISGCF